MPLSLPTAYFSLHSMAQERKCAAMEENTFSMSELKPGMSGIVAVLENEGNMRRRLMDLGLVDGSRVTCLSRSLWGDPAAYEICGAVIALRRADCSRILLRELRDD